MKTRFYNELDQLLIKDDISFQSELVNEVVYRELGIAYPVNYYEVGKILGFNFSPYCESEEISFHLPRLSMASLKKLLTFFQISEDDYFTNSPLVINENYLFKVFFPRFIEVYEAMKRDNDPLIIKHKEKSKKIFAHSIVKQMETDVYLILDFMRNSLESTPELGKLYATMMSLEELVPYLAITGKAESAYKEVMELDIPDVADEYLANKVLAIKEGIATYTRYRCSEAFPEMRRIEKNKNAFFSSDTGKEPCEEFKKAPEKHC